MNVSASAARNNPSPQFPTLEEHEACKPQGPWTTQPELKCGCGSNVFWSSEDGRWWCATCHRAQSLLRVVSGSRSQSIAVRWLMLRGRP
jgi:hypothetical protein